MTATATRAWTSLLLVLVVAAATMRLWDTPGTSDVAIWRGWVEQVQNAGPVAGYQAIQADYPPGASLILWLMTRASDVLVLPYHTMLKGTLTLALLVSTALVWMMTRRPFIAALLFGTLALNSVALLYLDVLTAPLIIVAVWASLTRRPVLMLGCIAGASLIKWQPLIACPFAIVHFVRLTAADGAPSRRRRARVIGGLVVAALALIVVAIYGTTPVIDSFQRATHHNDLSDFGANPLWIVTWLREGRPGLATILPASRPVLRVLTALTLTGYIWTLWRYASSRSARTADVLRYAAAAYLVYFVCSAGVHENHLFTPCLLTVLLLGVGGVALWPVLALGLIMNLNMLAFYGWRGSGTERLISGIDQSLLLAAVAAVVVPLVFMRLVRRA